MGAMLTGPRLPCKSLKYKIYAENRSGARISRSKRMAGLSRSAHALVAGGGRGIGRGIAAQLVSAGATVTVLGRNRATLDDAVTAGDAHFTDVADVTDQAAVGAAIEKAAARQPIDILIANAVIAESAPFAK